MSYLNASVPADTEAVSLGASRIRALAAALNTLIATLWSDAGVLLANVLPGAALVNNSVTATQLANNAVGAAQLANNAVGLSQTAQQATGSLVTYNGSQNPTLLAPGTSGQILSSNGTGPVWENVPAQAHGIPTFITPVLLVNQASTMNAWETVSGLGGLAQPVPSTATALILYIETFGNQGVAGNVQLRPNSSGSVYPVIQTSAGSSNLTNSVQGIFTFASGTMSFDYEATNLNWVSITIVGYIT